MLNNKIKSFDNFEKKYFEFIINKNNNENINQINNQKNDNNFRYLNLLNKKKIKLKKITIKMKLILMIIN